MKKTISIHLGGILFHIEEDGYELLNRYLISIRNYFSQYEDSQEIINDIESRIAELFTAQLLVSSLQALSLENVQEVIARMGSVADFAAAETVELDNHKLVRILENTLTPAGYSREDVSNEVLWQFNPAGVLECLNCEK